MGLKARPTRVEHELEEFMISETVRLGFSEKEVREASKVAKEKLDASLSAWAKFRKEHGL